MYSVRNAGASICIHGNIWIKGLKTAPFIVKCISKNCDFGTLVLYTYYLHYVNLLLNSDSKQTLYPFICALCACFTSSLSSKANRISLFPTHFIPEKAARENHRLSCSVAKIDFFLHITCVSLKRIPIWKEKRKRKPLGGNTLQTTVFSLLQFHIAMTGSQKADLLHIVCL